MPEATRIVRLADMTVEPMHSIIAPYDDAEAGVSIAIEDLDGRTVVSAGTTSDTVALTEVRVDIAAAGRTIGQVVGRSSAGHALVAAIVAGVAASIAALAEAVRTASEAATTAPDGDSERDRLAAELALACTIQRSFVPLVPPTVAGYDLAGHYQAAREVGGDFFDIFPIRKRRGRLAITIADVTGKGVAAALLMAFARPLLHAAVDAFGTPAGALERTNTILVEEGRSSLFITAMCAVIELRAGRMHLASAGHEPPLFVPASGAPPTWLEVAGPLLGAFSKLDLEESVIPMAPGDLVLLYTDGATDMQAPDGERFGDARLIAAVETARGGTATEVIASIVEACGRFQDGMAAADDMAMVAIRREPRRTRATRQQPQR